MADESQVVEFKAAITRQRRARCCVGAHRQVARALRAVPLDPALVDPEAHRLLTQARDALAECARGEYAVFEAAKELQRRGARYAALARAYAAATGTTALSVRRVRQLAHWLSAGAWSLSRRRRAVVLVVGLPGHHDPGDDS